MWLWRKEKDDDHEVALEGATFPWNDLMAFPLVESIIEEDLV